MLSLPVETIEEILSHVNEDDIKTLRSIILINRTWCKFGIHYLWKKPFHIENSPKNLYKIISIILFFLDKPQKKILKINDQRIEIPRTTLFDYPSFIRQLDISKIFLLIEEWISKNKRFRLTLRKDCFNKNGDKFIYNFSTLKKHYYHYEMEDLEELAFFESIFKIIIKKSKGIQKLNLDINNEHSFWKTYAIPNDYFGILFNGIDDIHKCFTGLKELSCDGNFYKHSIINKIKECSHEINELYINIWRNDYVKLKELLQVQKNLKSLSYSATEDINNTTIEGLQGMVAETLESLKISYGEIRNEQLKYLAKCKKLKKLSFDDVLFEGPIDLLTSIIFPNLENLKFSNGTFILDNVVNEMKVFIKNNGKNLKKIHLCQDLSGFKIFKAKDYFQNSNYC
ncbi:hypothetical protein C1645_743409 [Glomus cerebriforme]|uniref:F-box domain-containing protein n=1 Tax=Glomus cerebriforme TaxID=658196 RepID=A0A397SK91_9GLOM|nr:hypothetical protein C1645_743409 [Glomus cerebriforme]